MATLGGSLATTAARVPGRTALVSGDRRLTYAEFDAQVNRVAHALARQGLAKGDRCAVMGANSAAFIEVFYAVAKLGAIFVPVNPRSAPPEVAHILRDSGARIGLADADLLATMTAAAGEAGPHVEVLGLGGEAADLLALAREQPDTAPDVEVDERDDALILYTSGTTGFAKGVLMDHHRVLWVGLTCPIATCGMRDGERLIHVAPLYHAGQLTMMLVPGTLLGATHVVVPQFVPGPVLDLMERERITAFFGVPTMYRFFLRDPDLRTRDLADWRIGLYGAAPMPADTAAQLVKELPGVRLYSAYGQTEAGPSGIYSAPEEVAARPDATGRRGFVGMQVRVVDETGAAVAPGDVGEIQLRGETVMKGYWNNPEATAEAIRDGWLRTGDLARVDEDGYITIVDRIKDMIITGGANVYSVEVELAVAEHPAVADCAVIGVPHPEYGETVVAVVTPHPDAELTLEGLREFCADRVADYKLPRRLVLGPVPRNASGKILKRRLRTELAERE